MMTFLLMYWTTLFKAFAPVWNKNDVSLNWKEEKFVQFIIFYVTLTLSEPI